MRKQMSWINLPATLLLMALPAKPGHAGQEKGGGFAFSGTSGVLLTEAIQEKVKSFSFFDKACVNKVLEKRGLPQLDFDKMAKLILETRRAYTKEDIRKNLDGDDEPLAFNYGTDANGQYIEAQKIFFVGHMTYDRNAHKQEKKRLIQRVGDYLVHEASHHFGYNEQQAGALRRLLSWTHGNCIADLAKEGCYPSITPKDVKTEEFWWKLSTCD
jgi:hypothetical protein